MIRTIILGIFAVIIAGFTSKEDVLIKNSQNCSAELSVEKNRSFKSAYKDGANFKLTLKNTSQNTTTYDLTASKSLSPCSNKTSENAYSKSRIKNSDLNTSFKNTGYTSFSKETSKKNNSITLRAGQSKEFTLHAIVPQGTAYKTWGCIQVKANSTSCKSTSAEIILSVYIPDPSQN